MKHRHYQVPLLLSLIMMALSFAPNVVAQDAGTPAAPGEVVDPTLCTVDPRSVDELVVIFMEGDYIPDDELASGIFPEGEPADTATIALVTETAREVVACSNAGDYLAQMALFTDEGVQFFGPEESDATEEDIRSFFADTPVEPLPEDEREVFPGLTDVQVLEDGRIGAIFGASANDPGAVYVIFVEVDGRFLIDSAIELELEVASPEATPSS